jgi:hypothetical protein
MFFLAEPDKGIIGEWESEHRDVVHSLICFENGTGETGGEGMETMKIKWEVFGDEFKITSGEEEKTPIIMAKLVDNELVLRQPDAPFRGVLKFRRKKS